MPAITVLIGLMLILLGLGGYGYTHANGGTSPTSLIPAGLGLLILIFGCLAIFRENLRKHMMHAVVLLALIGFLGGAFMGWPKSIMWAMGSLTTLTLLQKSAVVMQSTMAILCLILLLFGIWSFIAARRNRIGETI